MRELADRIATRFIRNANVLDKIYESIWGRPRQGPEPVENAFLRRIAHKLHTSLAPIPPALIRESVMQSQKRGLYSGDVKKDALAYVWYTLMENRRSWPSMSLKERKALFATLSILSFFGGIPKYKGVLRLPDPDLEESVDEVVLSLAKWSLQIIQTDVKDTFYRICDAEGKGYVKKTDDFSSSTEAGYFLAYSFRLQIREKPLMFDVDDPFMLERLFELF